MKDVHTKNRKTSGERLKRKTGGIKVSFGKNLKMFRREKRWSQEFLSEQVDISVKHLSAIERGMSFVSAELLEKLSRSLEKPIPSFFIAEKDLYRNESWFNSIDSIVENRLSEALEDIKTDIRKK